MKTVIKNNDIFLIDLEANYVAISTAGCPKLYNEVRYVLFHKVPKDFEHVDLDKYCQNIASSIGLDYAKTTIFLTAVDVSTYTHGLSIIGSTRAEAFVTFGIDIPSCIGIEKPVKTKTIGTINTAVIVDKPLNFVGLLDLFRVVSEVKGMIMTLGGSMCISSASIGTPSDATMVAAPYGENRFAGIATEVGMAAAMATVCAMTRQIKRIDKEQYFVQTLGFSDINKIIEIAKEIYSKAKLPHLSYDDLEKELRDEIVKALKDPNLLLFVRGMRLLEAALAVDVFPYIDIREYKSDSPGIIVDELAGKSISEYLNGFKGLLMYYWIEKLKEKGETPSLKLLPPVTDDLVAALIGGLMSKIYDKHSR